MALHDIVQHFLLRAVPDLSRATHCLWLTLLTFALAVPVSAFLFRHVEEPTMRLGKSFDRHVALQPAE